MLSVSSVSSSPSAARRRASNNNTRTTSTTNTSFPPAAPPVLLIIDVLVRLIFLVQVLFGCTTTSITTGVEAWMPPPTTTRTRIPSLARRVLRVPMILKLEATTMMMTSSNTNNNSGDEEEEEVQISSSAEESTSSTPPPPPTTTVMMECTIPPSPNDDDNTSTRSNKKKRIHTIQQDFLQLAASYNRGFGASTRPIQQKAWSLIGELESLYSTNNSTTDAAIGILGNKNNYDIQLKSPLQGCWRLIWTSALDVVSLESSPFFSTGAIYQTIEPPIITNIIDLYPRIQSILPIPTPTTTTTTTNNNNKNNNNLFNFNTMFRLRVTTRAKLPTKSYQKINRIGLEFEQVQIAPIQIFGQTMDIIPPLLFDIRTPSWILDLQSSITELSSFGYFDVKYLDNQMLIIQQQGGGYFVSIRVDNVE